MRTARTCFFFFNDTATTEIYTLSLHDALPISASLAATWWPSRRPMAIRCCWGDRKSTRLNSSHLVISYAVFCLKKKKRHLGQAVVNMILRHLNDRQLPARIANLLRMLRCTLDL